MGLPRALQAEQRNAELEKLGVPVKIVTIGKKGAKYFKRRTDRFSVVGGRQLPAPSPCRDKMHQATRVYPTRGC